MTSLGVAILVTALATYALRAVPLTLVRGEITGRWLLSFLHYVPYAVLTAMTVPAIFLATSSWISGTAGFAVAVWCALRGRSLFVVALAGASAVWIVEVLCSMPLGA